MRLRRSVPEIGCPSQRVIKVDSCTLLALSGHSRLTDQCPLSGVKQTSRLDAFMSAFDPKRTYAMGLAILL